MKKPKYNPINLLSKLIKPIKYNMEIKPITRKQTLKLIDKLPMTNARGYYDINNKIIKHLKYELEPIIEQYFQDCMIEFMELHSIMSTDHHGGKKLHSTQTAMTQIYNKLYNKKEKKT